MLTRSSLAWLVGLFHALALPSLAASEPQTGRWHAWLESPGGAIPFGLELTDEPEGWRAAVLNPPERIEVARVELENGELRLFLDPYDSVIRARVSKDGAQLNGEWKRYRGPERWTVMTFGARAGEHPRFEGPAPEAASPSVHGRWSVTFSESDDPAVAILEADESGVASGTFLTTLGDYRYLAGTFDGKRLRLSCFDGAHAFLFTAALATDGTLAGDFYSRDTWHETWTARRDPAAALPDPFGLSQWNDAVPLADLWFPDLDGKRRSLADPAFAGRARLIVLFGSWCPNCHDETRYLVELDRRYRERGLAILGLAFEFGDEHARNAKQVRHYAEHMGARYPMLIAGPADKAEASRAFPAIDRVRAYPTTIFMDAAGEVRATYTGFSGPATGEAHERLRERFEGLIEELLTAD